MPATYPTGSMGSARTQRRRSSSWLPAGRSMHWGPVWAAALVSFALFVVFSLLWIALAYTDHGIGYWQRNLDWWEGGTAIAALFIGGSLLGRMQPDAASAAAAAGVMWALVETAGLILAVPFVLHHLGTTRTLPGPLLWITFGAAAIGLCAAMVGAGGANTIAAGQEPEALPNTELPHDAGRLVAQPTGGRRTGDPRNGQPEARAGLDQPAATPRRRG